MKFLINNKWELEIADQYLIKYNRSLDHREGAAVKGMRRSYFQFVVRSLAEVSREAWCIKWLLDHIHHRGSLSVAEYFGGMGMNATQIRNTLDVPFHAINDLDEDSFAHLCSLSRNRSGINYAYFDVISCKDAFELMGDSEYDCDLVCLDINSFTAHQWLSKPKIREGIDYVFENKPCYVILADSAISKLHLNKKVYSKEAKYRIDTPLEYMYWFSSLLEDAYGYVITHVAHHNAASYMLIKGRGRDEDIVEAYAPKDCTDFRRIE